MNRTFKRFKTRHYITKKWGILLLSFIISIGATSMPVSADSITATNSVDKVFDLYEINDVEAPIITMPDSYASVKPGQDYTISITVKDNKGIQDVSIFGYVGTYGTQKLPEQKMTLNTLTGKYEYTLSGDQIPKNTTFIKFFFIATDPVGLKATAYTPLIYTEAQQYLTTLPEDVEFQRVFGRTPGSDIFSDPEISEDKIYGEDIHIINPTEYPVIALPTYGDPARSEYFYLISATAQDNKGIREVTIDYHIGDKSFHGLKMNKSRNGNGRYDFYIPESQISDKDSTITYTVTVTNLDGLKTTTDELTVAINPESYTKTANNYKMSLFGHSDKKEAPKYNTLLHLPKGVSSVKEILSLNKNKKNVTVAGQVSYFVTDSEHPVIQTTTGGNIYSLYVEGSLGYNIKLGHQFILTGDYYIENGLPVLKNITSKEMIGFNKPADPKEVTIAYLKTHGLDMLGQTVKVKNVKLGTNHPEGLTEITDETGSISLYKSTYPEVIKSGDTVNLYAIVTCTGSTVQLRTGTPEANDYNIYETIDGKPTLFIIPTSPEIPKPHQRYFIKAFAIDNDGIQDVTISYTLGDKTISDKLMYQESNDSYYNYSIPTDDILASSLSFSYTITATDVNGLSRSATTTTSSMDDENLDIEILGLSPTADSISSNKNPTLVITFKNAGNKPKVSYTLTKDNQIISTETYTPLYDSFSSILGTLSAGNYTVNATIVRTEDGKELHHKWHFTISE
ncbi:hypothetical protein [Fusibacter ferrireducens]|uniref:Uncharacterized protein n=1 Tax=Fusibacter ferrireducens TaxID=2785058 RepID=A0ABR9ZZ90_9FIRM|nr:hypothetical protein [Fusibacter ferrireducens]MBF4695767.1 hypothetical protein [Fusibacter ferrireducens]